MASLAAVVVFGVLTVWATFRAGSTKRRLIYDLAQNTSLLQTAPTFARPDLKVLYRGEPLDDPRVAYVVLVSRGRKDITSEDFDDGQPLSIDVGARIVSVLGIGTTPHGLTKPALGLDNTKLEIWPSLIHKRQSVTIALLVDGPASQLTCDRRLRNVDVRAQADLDSMRNPVNALVYVTSILAILGMAAWTKWGAGPHWLWWLTLIFVVGPLAGLNGWQMSASHRRVRKTE